MAKRSPEPVFSQRTLVLLTAGLLIGAFAGCLSFLASAGVATAVAAGGIAFAVSVTGLHRLVE